MWYFFEYLLAHRLQGTPGHRCERCGDQQEDWSFGQHRSVSVQGAKGSFSPHPGPFSIKASPVQPPARAKRATSHQEFVCVLIGVILQCTHVWVHEGCQGQGPPHATTQVPRNAWQTSKNNAKTTACAMWDLGGVQPQEGVPPPLSRAN